MSTVQIDGIVLDEPDSAEAVIANAYALQPAITEEASESEELRRLTPRMERLLRASGLFRMGFPAAYGGLEMKLTQQVEVVTAVARADAGIAWNVAVLNATGYYAGRLSPEAFTELYPTEDRPTSGAFHPPGKAIQVDGGYLVTGNWGWGSGSYSADHIIGGCQVVRQDGQPVEGERRVLGVWLPKEAITVNHDWLTLGVRASGSTGYRITEPTFVPARHTFDRLAAPTAETNPLNKSVNLAFFGLAGIAIGLAQHAVDIAREALTAKAASPAPADQSALITFGEALCDTDALWSTITDIAHRTDEIIFTPGAMLEPLQEGRINTTQAWAGSVLRRVVANCAEVVGAQGVFDRHPMQRVQRDTANAIVHGGWKRSMFGHLANAAVNDDAAAPLLLRDEKTRPVHAAELVSA